MDFQKSNVTFRPLKRSEISFAVDAYEQMLNEIVKYEEIIILPTQKTLITIEHILLDLYNGGDECYVAVDGKAIVGYSIVMEQKNMDLKCKTFSGLGLFIEPDYRGQGVATELIRYTLDKLKEKGVQKFFASFIKERPTSQKMIDTFGFETTSVVCKTL